MSALTPSDRVRGLSTATTRITPEDLRALAAGDRTLTDQLDQALGTLSGPAAEAALIAADLRNRLAPEALAALRVELSTEENAA
ncbi:hypothetical protein [Mycobacteroides abscessus]|uniref:hypothetical protein n=1 Tax=Mycobacteroides abscessus TaxID=36809 RepID=UPI00149049EE|nr:hypothetical protein [Mycobacteroides abscessus]